MAFKITDQDRSDVWFEFDSNDIPTHSGSCDATVKAFCQINAVECSKLSKEVCIGILKPFGAWDREELEASELEELIERVIWVAAGNAADEPDLCTDTEDGVGTVEVSLSTY